MQPIRTLKWAIFYTLWMSSTGIAQQFSYGFDCSRLANDTTRATCYRQAGSTDPGNNTFGRYSAGINCLLLTNDEARARCQSDQASGRAIARPTAPQVESTVPPPPAPSPTIYPPTTNRVVKTPEPILASTGTGFFVSSAGHLITNAHVVLDCKRLIARRANGETFATELISIDERNDLALLRSTVGNVAASFRKDPAPLGEAIILYGFPLAGTLAVSGNLTTGSISGLAGLGNDPGKYQVSAPVQPGNSGGAVLDESGLVVGVVQSKLDALRAQKLTGDLPQNINFAIKGSLVQNFLEAQGIRYIEKPHAASRKASAIAADAIRFTVLIACYQ